MGDRTPDNSAKLLQRGRREGQYICDFSEGVIHAIKHLFFFFFLQKFSASHEENRHHEEFYGAFLDMRRYKN